MESDSIRIENELEGRGIPMRSITLKKIADSTVYLLKIILTMLITGTLVWAFIQAVI